MRVLMVRSNYPDPRLEKVADSLSKGGHDVTIVAWQRELKAGVDTGDRHPVVKMKLKVPYGVTLLLPIWWLFAVYHILKQQPDVIHCVDFDGVVPGRLANLLLRRKLVYEIYDYYSDVVRIPIWTSLTRVIDQRMLRAADLIIIADESRHRQIGHVHASPVVVILNSPPSTAVEQFGHPDGGDFRIYFGGTMMPDRGLMEAIEAVQGVKSVYLSIAGVCPDPLFRSRLLKKAERLGNVAVWPERVRHEEILAAEARSHLLFALYDPRVPNNKFASPNKLFEAMMLGKPIIVSDGTAMADIVRAEMCGIVVPYGDVGALRETITMLADDRTLAQDMGRRGRDAYMRSYSWREMEKRLQSAYAQMLRQRGEVYE